MTDRLLLFVGIPLLIWLFAAGLLGLLTISG